ncbi:ATP-binding protein [Streptomyces sp. NBC_01244]|uniref:ATP-binding protein n=1 Tax=Streptomyces sp. NBC_01244 TaxID=2903797 RepID=UPI002E11FF7F|nr:ATP-binding protein [Streptomyces sp. NBC_01244]
MTLHLRQHSDLDGTTAAGTARDLTRHFFDDASRGGRSVAPAVMDTTLLLVSELVTNAIRHTADGCVLDLELEPDEIAIDVTDYSDAEPRLRAPDLEGGGGWGWALVHRLGSGVRIRHRPGGKTIHTGVRLFPPH